MKFNFFKQLCYYIVAILFLFTILNSCHHEREEKYKIPAIYLVPGSGFVSGDVTLEAGIPFNVSVTATSNSGEPLVAFKITKSSGSQTITVLDSALQTDTLKIQKSLVTNNDTVKEKWTFVVSDEGARANQQEFIISTTLQPPAIILYAAAGYASHNSSLVVGGLFKIKAELSANSSIDKIASFKITKSFGSNQFTMADINLNCAQYTYLGQFNANQNVGVETWNFRLTLSDGRYVNKTILITTLQELTPMNEEHTAAILWNYIGTNSNAWDLVSNISVALSSPEDNKDMVNYTLAPGESPYYFYNGWYASNETRFIRANFIDYQNAKLEDLVDVFSGSTIGPKVNVSSISEDDVVIARLRNTSEYVVIKVTGITFTTNDDLDKIEFSYKKRVSK